VGSGFNYWTRIYNLLRLGPGFNNLSSRNQDYIFSPLRLLSTPWDPFVPHLFDLTDWFLRLLGIPLILTLIVGIYTTFKTKDKGGFNLLVWSLLPMLVLMALLKTFTTRYVLFLIPSLLCIAALGIDTLISSVRINKKTFLGVILIILMLWPTYFNYLVLTNPSQAPIPINDRKGYFEEWTAGYGLREIAEIINTQSEREQVVVGTEGIFGTLPDGIQIYFDKNRNVAIIGTKGEVTEQLKVSALTKPTYFIANKSRFKNLNDPTLKLIKEYPKAVPLKGDQDATLFFQVLPSK
jgi:hypothetical protein